MIVKTAGTLTTFITTYRGWGFPPLETRIFGARNEGWPKHLEKKTNVWRDPPNTKETRQEKMFIFFFMVNNVENQRGGVFFSGGDGQKNPLKSNLPMPGEKTGGTPQLFCEAALPPKKHGKKKFTIVQTWNELNAWWVFHVMILSCIQRFFHVFHGFKVLHPKKILSFPRSVFFHPFRNWPVLTWATEHRMVASFFFKAGYVENLRWTVAGESVVMFHHALKKTTEVCLAFVEPFCWKRNGTDDVLRSRKK